MKKSTQKALVTLARWQKVALTVLGLAAIALAGWLAAPHTTERRMITVGVVQLTEVDVATFRGFKEGMAELGHVEGENIRYLYPGPAHTIDALDGILRAHLDAKVDLLFVSSTPATLAAKRATSRARTPIVFAPVNDPVKAGVVDSLQSPGTHVTGVRLPQGDALRLQWLHQIVPGIRTVLLPHNPNDESSQESLRQIRIGSAALGIELLPQPVPDSKAIIAGLSNLPSHVDAILLPRDSSVESHIDQYVQAALKRRLPLCAPSLTQVEAGALLSYGFVHYEIGRQAAHIAHQILQGVSPADLPVETANNYLAINLRTADALGLEIPPETVRNAHMLIH